MINHSTAHAMHVIPSDCRTEVTQKGVYGDFKSNNQLKAVSTATYRPYFWHIIVVYVNWGFSHMATMAGYSVYVAI